MSLKQFINSIKTNIETQGQFDITPLTSPALAFTVGNPSSPIPLSTIYWFRPWVSSEFQPLAANSGVTKDYFFLYSTDHSTPALGEIRLGQANNLDLSDFEDIGSVYKGDQAETPFLIRLPDFTEEFHFYFQTYFTEPGNQGVQQTRLYTTENKSLINIKGNWTDRGRPFELRLNEGEQHSGYAVMHRINRHYWTSRHLLRGLVPVVGPLFGISTSIDGRNWTRLKTATHPQYWLDRGYRANNGEITMVKLNGEYFGIGLLIPEDRTVTAGGMKLFIGQFDENGEYVKTLGLLNEGVETNFVSLHQDTNTTFYLYWSTEQKSLWVQRFKVTNGTMSPRIVDQN